MSHMELRNHGKNEFEFEVNFQNATESEAVQRKALESVIKIHGVPPTALGEAAPFPGETGLEREGRVCLCECCQKPEIFKGTIVCDGCDFSFHLSCVKLSPKHAAHLDDWRCRSCSGATSACTLGPPKVTLRNVERKEVVVDDSRLSPGMAMDQRVSSVNGNGGLNEDKTPMQIDLGDYSDSLVGEVNNSNSGLQRPINISPGASLASHSFNANSDVQKCKPKSKGIAVKDSTVEVEVTPDGVSEQGKSSGTPNNAGDLLFGNTALKFIIMEPHVGVITAAGTTELSHPPENDILLNWADDQHLKKVGEETLQQLRDYMGERHGLQLADGWAVEVRPRKLEGHLDKYFISPEKQRFRSRLEVMRHLGFADGLKSKPDTQLHGPDDWSLLLQHFTKEKQQLPPLPLLWGDLRIESLGNIDLRPGYHNDMNIWPVGYRCSWHDSTTASYCISEVADGGTAPLFQVTRKPCLTMPILTMAPTTSLTKDGKICVDKGSDLTDKNTKGKNNSEINKVMDVHLANHEMLVNDNAQAMKSQLGSIYDQEYEDTMQALLCDIGGNSQQGDYVGSVENGSKDDVSNNQETVIVDAEDLQKIDDIGEFTVEGRSTSKVWRLFARKFSELCNFTSLKPLKHRCPHTEFHSNVADWSEIAGNSLCEKLFEGGNKPAQPLSVKTRVASHVEPVLGENTVSAPEAEGSPKLESDKIGHVYTGKITSESEHLVLLEQLGEDRFGFNLAWVKGLIELLPSADKCEKYRSLVQRGVFWKAELSVAPQTLRVREKGRRQKKSLDTVSEDAPVEQNGQAEGEEQKAAVLIKERPGPPLGKPVGKRIPPDLIGDVLQIWEFLCRFWEVLGQAQPPLLEEVEEMLLCRRPANGGRSAMKSKQHGKGTVKTHKRKVDGVCVAKVGSSLGLAGNNDRETRGVQQHDTKESTLVADNQEPQRKSVASSKLVCQSSMQQGMDHNFVKPRDKVRTDSIDKNSQSTVLTSSRFPPAASAHIIPLIKFLLLDLECKVCGREESDGDAEEPRGKRGRKRIRDMVGTPALGRDKIGESFPMNEVTWPEIARRYMVARIRVPKIEETAEESPEDCMKVLRCIQGDGGVLCGALDGVAGMEVDAQLLAEAEKELSVVLHETEDTGVPTTPTQLVASKDLNDDQKAVESGGENAEWAQILDPIAKLPTNVGSRIRNRVRDAIAAGPPDWAVEILVHSISKDVYKGNASGPTKRAVLDVLAKYRGEEPQSRKSKKNRKKVLPSPEVVMQRCRIVLRQVAASDTKQTLGNIIGGATTNFYEYEGDGMVARPLDFRAIDLRLGAGAYGTSPEAFAADVRQIWRNVAGIYGSESEEAQLANSLSELFESMYSKQVILFQGGGDGTASTFDGKVLEQNAGAERQGEGENVKAPWEDDSCRVCGIDDDHDNVLLCDGCDAEYHIYCLNPPLSEVPEGNWYCSSCVAVDKGFPEGLRPSTSVEDERVTEKHKELQILTEIVAEQGAGKVEIPTDAAIERKLLQDLAERLAEKEYWELRVADRVLVLKFLCDQALETPKLRVHLKKCVYMALEYQQKLRSAVGERRKIADVDENRLETSRDALSVGPAAEVRASKLKRKYAESSENMSSDPVTKRMNEGGINHAARREGTTIKESKDPADLACHLVEEHKANLTWGNIEKQEDFVMSERSQSFQNGQKLSAEGKSVATGSVDLVQESCQHKAALIDRGAEGLQIKGGTITCRDLPRKTMSEREGSSSGKNTVDPNESVDGIKISEKSELYVLVGSPEKLINTQEQSIGGPRVKNLSQQSTVAGVNSLRKHPPIVGSKEQTEYFSERGGLATLKRIQNPQAVSEEAPITRSTSYPVDVEIVNADTELMKVNFRRDFLGRDDLGRMYWALNACQSTPWLAVENANRTTKPQEPGPTWTAPSLTLDSSQIPEQHPNRRWSSVETAGCGLNHIEQYQWYSYTEDEELNQLLAWLTLTSAHERALKLLVSQFKSLLQIHRVLASEKCDGLPPDSYSKAFSPASMDGSSVKARESRGLQDPAVVKTGDFPRTKATTILELKYGQFSESAVKDVTSPVPKRGRKRKSQPETKLLRCDCLEPIWLTRCHCLFCHITFDSAAELLTHSKSTCINPVPETEPDQEVENRNAKRGSQPGKPSLEKGQQRQLLTSCTPKAPQTPSPDQVVSHNSKMVGLPDISLMPFYIPESTRDRILQIGCIADKGPTFAPGLLFSPAFDPSLMIIDLPSPEELLSMDSGAYKGLQMLDTVAVGATSCVGIVDESAKTFTWTMVKSSHNLPGRTQDASKSPHDLCVGVQNERSSFSPANSRAIKLDVLDSLDKTNNSLRRVVGSRQKSEFVSDWDHLPSVPFNLPVKSKSGARSFHVTGKQLIISEASLRPVEGLEELKIFKQLKIRLLDVEAALTIDMLEAARGYPARRRAWRSFVKSAKSIYVMVQATILVEQMVCSEYLRSSWCYWSSFSAAAKTASLSSLALRIYALDSAIAYDKDPLYAGLDLSAFADSKLGKKKCQSLKTIARKRKKEDMAP